MDVGQMKPRQTKRPRPKLMKPNRVGAAVRELLSIM
jgi:hypothetical protein